jgi:trans-aconitate methyltransferase
MPSWFWIFIIVAGGIFALKMTYALSIALVLPVTGGALYVSTPEVRIATFLDAVPMNSGQFLFDLGCGDGRVLRRVRKRYGVQAIGFEINPLAYLKARVSCLGTRGIDIRLQNFWKADINKADVVFCYLFPDVMKALSTKLKKELKPGAVIVSCNFKLPDLIPEQVLRPDNSLFNDPIYIYRIPESGKDRPHFETLS